MTALYRLYDEGGELLYVGISKSALGRLGQHVAEKSWANEIAFVRIEYLETRQLALEAEAKAIRCEYPRYNVAGTLGQWSRFKTRRESAPIPWTPRRLRGWWDQRLGRITPDDLDTIAREPNMPQHMAWKLRACAAQIRFGADPHSAFFETVRPWA